MLPTGSKGTPTTKTAAFIMGVGALLTAIVMLIGYLAEFPAEFYVFTAPVVGSFLAVWRTGVGLPRSTRGYTRIELLSSLLLGSLAIATFALIMSTTGCMRVVPYNNPGDVFFDVNRETCEMTVDIDGKRVFEINPGLRTRCSIKVVP